MVTVIRTTEELLAAFECVICTNLFDIPKNLPNCGHTYCLKCLGEIPKTNSVRGPMITCPECRVLSPVGSQGVAAYQTNISTQRMVDTLKSQLMSPSNKLNSLGRSLSVSGYAPENAMVNGACSHITKDSLAFYCLHCKSRFCQACQISHMERLKIEIRNISGKFDQRVDKALGNMPEKTKQISDYYATAVSRLAEQASAKSEETVQIVSALIRAKADDIVREAKKTANEQMDMVRVTFDTCRQRRARLASHVDHVMTTSVLRLSLDEVARLHGDVISRDNQIKALEALNQGHFVGIQFQPADDTAKLIAAVEALSLGSLRRQPGVQRCQQNRLRQTKSCFNVSFVGRGKVEDEAEADDEDDDDDELNGNTGSCRESVYSNNKSICNDDDPGGDLKFHQICGVNARISANGVRASKNFNEFTRSVCFTNRPVEPGERVHLFCLFTDDTCVGGSAVGFTSIDPASLPKGRANLLQEDCLLNGGAEFFWAASDVLAENGSDVAISYTASGRTRIAIKDGKESDGEDKVPVGNARKSNIRLWGVINLFGATSCVKISRV